MQRLVFVLPFVLVTGACSPTALPVSHSSLYVFRFDPPALVEIDSGDQPLREIPVTIPGGCGLDDVFAPTKGTRVALELTCPFGQAVLVADTATGALQQPITDSDSHFLAWSPDGEGLYLKVNSIDRPQIVRIGEDGARTQIPITELTYDLAPAPGGNGDFLFSFSRGMGLGSEMWFAQDGGLASKQISTDSVHYLSLARWSPDGKQLGYIKIPDSPTPYTVGELWVMRADGTAARWLAEADAGHGFAPSWSPDGSQLAFVYRENPLEAEADQSARALISNIHAVSVQGGQERPLTLFQAAQVEAPTWQPDGSDLAFTVVLNDKMQVYVLDVTSGTLQHVPVESACCAAWVRK